MKKTKMKLIAAICLMMVSVSAFAQKQDIQVGVNTHISTYDKEFAPLEVAAEVGYGFTDCFSAGLRVEQAYAHVDKDGAKTYNDNTTLGLVAKGDVVKFGNSGLLSLKGAVGSTLKNGTGDWKYWYYDGGLLVCSTKGATRPELGIGVRYYDGRGDGSGNKFRVYLSLGFTFGL